LRDFADRERAKFVAGYFKTGPGEYGEGDRFLGLNVPQLRLVARGAAIYSLYLASTDRINNWDLVDASAPQIVGGHLADRSRTPLYRLVKSKNVWERRIAIIATSHFIRRGEFDDTLALATALLNDAHDLIHKAAGWMLREVGNRDRRTVEAFLRKHAARIPRTMLRYAIERFPEPLRRKYLSRKRGTSVALKR